MSRAIWILAVLLSHWRRHPMQLATLLIGLISATALWSGVQALNQQARESYDRAAAIFGGARTAMLVARNGATFSQDLFVKLRRAGWPVSPVLEGRVQIGGHSFRLLGIEPVTLPAEVGNSPTIGKASLQAFIAPPGQTLVAPETLADLHLSEGASPSASNGVALPPLQAQPQLVPDVLVVDIGLAQRLLNKPDQISRLLVGNSKSPREVLENVTGDALRLVEPDAETDLERLTDSFHLNLTAFGLLSFFVGLFIVNSAIGLAYEQRLATLRTLRACGVSARLMNAVLVFELVSLALVAGIIGLVCGYFIAAQLLPDVAASLRGLYGAPMAGELSLKREWWIAGLVISVTGALIAAATSLAKAVRLPVLAAAQPRAWQQAQRRWLILQGAAALAIFAVAGWLLWAGNSLIAGFGVLAALLFGAALILPAILEVVLSLGERGAHGALASWFWADSRQQLSGLSLALMALLLALAVNVGVATMVETFSKTFLTWLDGRLAADVYVSAADNAQADAIKAWLRGRNEVKAVLAGGRADTQIGGAPIEVLGLPDDATYRDHWPLLQSDAQAWQELPRGETCFISEQLSRRMKSCARRNDCGAYTGRRLAASDRRHLCRLRQPQGPDRGQCGRAVQALSGRPADAARTARRAWHDSRARDRTLGDIRTRWTQPARPGGAEGGIDAHIQSHFRRDQRAERVHARRCRRRIADQPVDVGQFAPAAACAALGGRRDKAEACRDRADQDTVGRVHHRAAGIAARSARRLVPDRHRQCEGVRLAAAVPCLPAGTGQTAGRCAGGVVIGLADTGRAAGADAAGQSGQGLCQ